MDYNSVADTMGLYQPLLPPEKSRIHAKIR